MTADDLDMASKAAAKAETALGCKWAKQEVDTDPDKGWTFILIDNFN